jgi:hypothetical protein
MLLLKRQEEWDSAYTCASEVLASRPWMKSALPILGVRWSTGGNIWSVGAPGGAPTDRGANDGQNGKKCSKKERTMFN